MKAQRAISRRQQQAMIGRRLEVLVEGRAEETEHLLAGRHAQQAPEIDGITYINDGVAWPGELVTVEVTDAMDYDLVGKVVARDPQRSARRLPKAAARQTVEPPGSAGCRSWGSAGSATSAARPRSTGHLRATSARRRQPRRNPLHEGTRRLNLLARAGLVDHERLGVVRLLPELLEAGEQPGRGSVEPTALHDVQVEQVQRAVVRARLEAARVENGAARVERREVPPAEGDPRQLRRDEVVGRLQLFPGERQLLRRRGDPGLLGHGRTPSRSMSMTSGLSSRRQAS